MPSLDGKIKIKLKYKQLFFFVYKEIFVKSWWVIAFILFSFILYEQSLENRAEQREKLIQQLFQLQKEREAIIRQREDLELQINSQSDLAWIELTLIKVLGLVPEGQQKVYFYKDPNISQK